MTANMTIATQNTKHPIPVYSHVFSAKEEGFASVNVETYKGLNLVKQMFGDKKFTVVMD